MAGIGPQAQPIASRAASLALAALITLAAPIQRAAAENRSRTRRDSDLAARVAALVSTAKIGQAQVGISIVDLSTGRILFEQNPTTALIPASNHKLLTSGVALSVLGPDYVFKTELLIDNDRLVIRGSGDPALADPAVLGRMTPPMTVDGLIETLASSLPRAGIAAVSEVIVDDRIFDRQYVHPTWPVDQLNNWYCAQVAGVNFHTNVLSFYPAPVRSSPGAAPTLTIQPDLWWLEIDNRARSTPQGRNAVWIRRDIGTNKFTLSGEVALPTRESVDVTVHEPALLFGQAIAAQLPRAGVSIAQVGPIAEGAARVPRAELDRVLASVRLAREGEAIGGRPIAVVTTSLRDIIDRCNADSQNMYAEALIKALGHAVTGEQGSWTNGSSVVRMTVSQVLGPDAAASTVVADGSGMSRDNRVTPRTLTRWLERMAADSRFNDAFIESLASPGEGTLRRRFQDERLTSTVRAKSGLLRQVRCLSGYVTARDGRRVAFSIMLNDLPRGDGELQGRNLTESIVVAIDRWLAAQAPAAPTPSPSPRASGTPR